MHFLNNYYKGNRIFILGNAPSLSKIIYNEAVADKLHRYEFTFGMHRVALAFDNTVWRPYFYICATRRVEWSDKYKLDVKRALASAKYSFIATRIKEEELFPPYSDAIKFSALHITDKEYSPPKKKYWNPSRFEGGSVSIYGHTGMGAIQLAVYMGFNPIILGGMDMTYHELENKNIDTNHFHPEYEAGNVSNSNYELYNKVLHESHEFTAKMAKKNGVDILSLDTNVNLDYYPQVSIKDVL